LIVFVEIAPNLTKKKISDKAHRGLQQVADLLEATSLQAPDYR
jgi:hypothetical protein